MKTLESGFKTNLYQISSLIIKVQQPPLLLIMPNGDKLRPKNTREHLLAIYGYITGIKKDMKHMHDGIHDLGGKIDKIYWALLATVGAVALLLLEKIFDKGWF